MNLTLHKRLNRVLSILLILCTVFVMAQMFPTFVLSAEEDEPLFSSPIDYYRKAYATAEEKWDSMDSQYTVKRGTYEMRIDTMSMEVAIRNLTTGEISFSNPYNLAASSATESVRRQLLSQVILSYKDITTATTSMLYSFENAVQNKQATVKGLNGGFAVSYTMGTVKKRSLVPRRIEATRFEELILDKITDEQDLEDLLNWFIYADPNDPVSNASIPLSIKNTCSLLEEINPVTGQKYCIYYLDEEALASVRHLSKLQEIIKSYAPDYTFSEVEADHEQTGFEEEKSKLPLFKLTLEYYLDANGMRVSLPTNSIRFDETIYALESVTLLPFFGCGDINQAGYSFLPDGSGALVNFGEGKGRIATIGGKLGGGSVYGEDYSLHSSEVSNSEAVRLPVFGVVEKFEGKVGYPDLDSSYQTKALDRGFFAIIEDGESLAAIATEYTNAHPYQSAYAAFYPRPSDKYNLSDSISAASSNAVYNITADRKYTGNCTVRYYQLNAPQILSYVNYAGYEASYVGMAKLYRDYLTENGTISRLLEAESTLPLYIESFGAMQVQDSFLSIPIEKTIALTTFEDLRTMHTELSAAGITNLNFRLTGFVNGGMVSTAPTKIKFERVLGGTQGYNDFVAYAKDRGFGVYTDFDFTEIKATSRGDGISYKKDALKTIDNRYIQSKSYDPAFQTYQFTGNLLLSPEAYVRMYSQFVKSMSEYDAHIGVSVGSLGSALNSDFDEDDAYNRDETQELSRQLLNRLQSAYGSVMIDAGNAYALPYADHVLNVALDSSHYQSASRAIPFVGMVLHGYVQFAGYATNTASDSKYETLKIIENGALPYYILSYQNTNKLKEDEVLSQYYAVSYEFGKDDMIAKYQELNGLLADLQTVRIDDHVFLPAMRVPSAADVEYDTEIGLTPEEIVAKYTFDDGTVVKVTYENGVFFYLNYNSFEVTVNGVQLGALGYFRGVE